MHNAQSNYKIITFCWKIEVKCTTVWSKVAVMQIIRNSFFLECKRIGLYSNGETWETIRLMNHSKRVLWNMEGRNMGIIKGKVPKQGLTSAKDLNIELREGCESPYHRLDKNN